MTCNFRNNKYLPQSVITIDTHETPYFHPVCLYLSR